MPDIQTPATNAVLGSFYLENANRYYPLVNANPIPTRLILGFGLIATTELPDNSGSGIVYLSKVVTDGTHIRFYMAMNDVNGLTTDFGCMATVNVSSQVNVRTNFQYIGDDLIFEGFIITGDTQVASKMPPVTELSPEEGKIHTSCIYHMTNWVAGLRVDGKIYGGIVTLEAGPGVSITANDNVLTILCSGTIPPDNDQITTDEQILDKITEAYGTPITTINGAPCGPHWSILTKESEGLRIDLSPTTYSITISNDKAAACCTQDDIAVLVDNISALNDRAGVLQSFQEQLETNLNILSAQMSRVL